ncbi:MAG TPA: hypothetical protein VEV81_01030, partial [Pyrinomonadaceae bacterium]|nr:hypothetical protein [Pyrinomonadaceae bacterium]
LAGALNSNRTSSSQGNAHALTEVKVCPMNGEVLDDVTSAPSEVVGNYKVYFCCAHHKEAFNKLPQKEQEQKIAAALEKQNKKNG